MPSRSRCGVDLYWLPLGARGHCLRIGGKLFEAVSARLERREARDIYHSVLEVHVPEGRFVIEMGPVVDMNGAGASLPKAPSEPARPRDSASSATKCAAGVAASARTSTRSTVRDD